MTTDKDKNAKMTTELVVNFVFFETLTTEKSATATASPLRSVAAILFRSAVLFIKDT